MSNIVTVLKVEIARAARKQVRGETASLKRAVRRHRTDLAALKREVAELSRALKVTRRAAVRSEPLATQDAALDRQRFTAKGLISHRRRLDLSAADLGKLLGVSGQSIYLWENGKARPRVSMMPAIAALRTLGKKQAAAVVAERS
jgi:DNA-binding XRE family transcriptional regulator